MSKGDIPVVSDVPEVRRRTSGMISDASVPVRRYPERLQEKLPQPGRRPSRRSKP